MVFSLDNVNDGLWKEYELLILTSKESCIAAYFAKMTSFQSVWGRRDREKAWEL